MARSPRWSASLRSIGRAGRCVVAVRFGVGDERCGRRCTWGRYAPPAAIPPFGCFTTASWRRAKRRRSRWWRACTSCSPSSTPWPGTRLHGRLRPPEPARAWARHVTVAHLSSWAHGVQGVGVEGGVTMSKVRPATPTVAFIDQYCAQYRDLFQNVRHFEQFTALHLGLLAETRPKSLPRLGTTVHADPQALNHLMPNADYAVESVRARPTELFHHTLWRHPS